MEQQMIQELKAKYVGQWISVKDGELIATSESHEELYDTLKEKSISGAYVFYSPTESEKRYEFLFPGLTPACPVWPGTGDRLR